MIALFRHIPDSFVHAISRDDRLTPLDVGLARAQQRAVAAAMAAAGAEIHWIAAGEHPDACFIEDTAVLLPGLAVISRPGAEARRPETVMVAGWLAARWGCVSIEPPGTVDGGDVLVLGDRVLIGRSSRTNADGARQLGAIAAARGLIAIEVPTDDLHLKCRCSALDDRTILRAEDGPDAEVFGDRRVLTVPTSEGYAANAVAVGRAVLLASGHPSTAALVRSAGFRVVEVDTSELRRADGALTCLSLRAIPGIP
jgi:dimethylargininase